MKAIGDRFRPRVSLKVSPGEITVFGTLTALGLYRPDQEV